MSDISRSESHNKSSVTAHHRKVRAAALSVASNSMLTVVKLGIGYFSGSVSILSEAVHSGTDLIASGIALFSVRASDTPADFEHPYGHGKIESLSGLAEAVLIFVAAAYISFEIFDKIRTPAHISPHGLNAGIIVMAASMVLNFCISGYLFVVAKQTDSQALQADAKHLQSDVLSSLGVLVGLSLVRLTGIAWFDPLVASVVALVLIRTAYRLTYDAIQLLLDIRLPDSEEAAIVEILKADSRVLGYHKLRTRKSGSQRHVDVHVQLDDDCSLVYAHNVAEEIEDAIRDALPATIINIHIEPYIEEMKHQREVHGAAVP